MDDSFWKRLLECQNLKQRLHQLRFWHVKEKLRKKEFLKDEKRKRDAVERRQLGEGAIRRDSPLFLPAIKLGKLIFIKNCQ